MKSKEEIEQLAEKHYTQITLSQRTAFKFGYTQCQRDMLHDQTLTRFEVIDENGRVYSQWNCNIELSYQDDGRTLKVFIKKLI